MKILDTVLCKGISKRIKLSAGDKIKGSLEIVGTKLEDAIPVVGFIPSLRLVIYRLGKKHWWGEEKEVVYETLDIGNQPYKYWDILFEVLEDGEYLIEVKEYICCFKVQLYLEREAEDKTVPYPGKENGDKTVPYGSS